MRIKSRKSVIALVAGVLGVFALTYVSLVPDILLYPKKYSFRRHVRGYLETTFDLAGSLDANTKAIKWGKVTTSLFRATIIDGTYPVEMEDIRIDIKFKHWQRIATDRDRAFRKSVLRDPSRIPARILYQGEVYNAELRLKGDLDEHRALPNRWSFRIKLKGGASIKGFSEFSLQRAAARQFPFDQLYHHWHQAIGGLGPNFDFSRVYVNGDYWGIMLMEEHVTKSMIEKSRRKEAPLFKLSSEDGWYYSLVNEENTSKPDAFYGDSQPNLYGAKKYRADDRMLSLYSYALMQIRKLNRDGIEARDIVAFDATTRSLLLAMAWGNQHTLAFSNTRFYLNPFTLLIEPINTDQGPYMANPQDPADLPFGAGFFGQVVKNKAFEETFIRAFREMEANLSNLVGRHRELCAHFPADCPEYDPAIIQANMEWIDKVAKPVWFSKAAETRKTQPAPRAVDLSIPGPSSQQDSPDGRGVDYPEYVFAEHYNDGRLRLYNLLSRPVNITKITLVCDKKAPADCRDESLMAESFKLKGSVKGRDLFFELIDTRIRDLGGEYRIEIEAERNGHSILTEVVYTLRTGMESPLLLNRDSFDDIKKPAWLAQNGRAAFVAPGTWEVKTPLILPVGMDLYIPAGASLRFHDDAYLIARGAIVAVGREDAPIEFVPMGEKWKGIYVLGATETSSLSHVRVRGTDFLKDGVLQLTGGVTFYKSDVNISHAIFEGATAEDALNIVSSKFTISDTVFRANRSDAFDSDFSSGSIEDSTFYGIGGDGVDLSGSQIISNNLKFTQIRDKAISVGEKSTLRAKSIAVTESGSAVVSKDGSQTIVDGLTVTASQGYAAMAYMKKSIYGTARLEISNSNLHHESVLNQKGNVLILEGHDTLSKDLNVDVLYSTQQMKKSATYQ